MVGTSQRRSHSVRFENVPFSGGRGNDIERARLTNEVYGVHQQFGANQRPVRQSLHASERGLRRRDKPFSKWQQKWQKAERCQSALGKDTTRVRGERRRGR